MTRLNSESLAIALALFVSLFPASWPKAQAHAAPLPAAPAALQEQEHQSELQEAQSEEQEAQEGEQERANDMDTGAVADEERAEDQKNDMEQELQQDLHEDLPEGEQIPPPSGLL